MGCASHRSATDACRLFSATRSGSQYGLCRPLLFAPFAPFVSTICEHHLCCMCSQLLQREARHCSRRFVFVCSILLARYLLRPSSSVPSA